MDRYTAWRGGAAFERLRSIRFDATLTASGLHGTETFWADRTGRQRIDTDLGVIKQTQSIAPAGAWDTSPSGQVETLSVADLHNLAREAALQFPDVLRGRAGATATLDRPAEWGGRAWAVVRVRFGDTDIYDVLIDPKTGELGGFHIVEDRAGRFERFGDWRMVGGVRMPFLQTVKSDDSADIQEVRITRLALNGMIPMGRLERPAPVHKAIFKGGASSTGWIDFEFYNDNRIFLPARVNGHDTVVLLDSVATVSSADKAFAASIGLAPKGRFSAPGAGGVDTTGFAEGVEIQVGNATLHGVDVATFDFSPIARRIGHPLPFVLGNEAFNEFAVEIDFAHRRLAFHDPNRLVVPNGAVMVPLLRIKDRAVPISIEGGRPVPFEFDLGDGSPLDIYPSYYKAHRLLEGRRTSQVDAGGVGGFNAETVATIREVDFAGVAFHDVPTDFSPDVSSANNSDLLFGTVGLPLLARFHLIVDYTHDRLFAVPQREVAEAPFAKDRLGVTLVRTGDVAVASFVSPGGPAEAAGLKAGDRIQALDGRPAAGLSDNAIAALRFQPVGKLLTLTLSDGGVRTVTCRDFF